MLYWCLKPPFFFFFFLKKAHLVFDTFFWSGQSFEVQAAKDVMAELERVREWMMRQTSHRFYSSSLLIVYEGDNVLDTPTIRRQLDESETDEVVYILLLFIIYF